MKQAHHLKKLLFAMCFFFSLHSIAQNLNSPPSDTTLATYIKDRHYTKLTDTVHIQKYIMPYYAAMMDFMTGDKLYLRDCYIPVAGVRDETYTITISLWDLASIRMKKVYEEDRSNIIYSSGREGMKVLLTRSRKPLPSNPSGHCGELVINKLSGKVVFKLISI